MDRHRLGTLLSTTNLSLISLLLRPSRPVKSSCFGLLSPNYLNRVPEQVVAAAGQTAWRQNIAPTTQDANEMQAFWNDFTEEVTQALDTEPPEATPTDGPTTPTEVAD
jgi:hypothetical protein